RFFWYWQTEKACFGQLPDIEVSSATGTQRAWRDGKSVTARTRVWPCVAFAIDHIQHRAVLTDTDGIGVPASRDQPCHLAVLLCCGKTDDRDRVGAAVRHVQGLLIRRER